MSNQQKLLRKFKNISRVLTRCQNMEVKFEGQRAYHQQGKIVLPIGDFSDDDFVTMSVGYCDHELGHENYTDKAFYEKSYVESKYLNSLLNMLDDAHQEARLMAEFKGCKTTLRKVVELGKEKGIFAKPTDKFPEHLLLKAWVLYGARSANAQPLSEYFKIADLLVQQKFGDEFYKDLLTIFRPANMHMLDSTEKCYLVAKQIFDLFMSWVEQQEDNSESDSSDSDDADGSDDSESDSSDSDDADGSDDSESDSSDSDDADGSDDSEGDSSDSDDADGSDDSEGDSSDSDDAESSDDSSSSNTGNKQRVKDRIKASLEEDDEDDFHELMRKEIEAMAKGADIDTIQPLPIIVDRFLSTTQSGKVRATDSHKLVSSLKKPLKRVFHEQNYCKKSLNKKGANICSSRLSSVVTGNSRIFEKETVSRSPNSAVTLLVDKSASMEDIDMKMANTVGYSMSAALDAIKGVSNMCAYYPSYQYKNSEYSDDSLAIVKHFDQKAKLQNFNFEGSGSTPTAEAIITALSLLVTRPEPRKLLFVVTDGGADNTQALRSAISEANALGVKVFGIGINLLVQGFEEADFTVIHSETELVDALKIGLKNAFK